jgi:hypothetical protein
MRPIMRQWHDVILGPYEDEYVRQTEVDKVVDNLESELSQVQSNYMEDWAELCFLRDKLAAVARLEKEIADLKSRERLCRNCKRFDSCHTKPEDNACREFELK